jgi:hypothetical protein
MCDMQQSLQSKYIPWANELIFCEVKRGADNFSQNVSHI